MAYRLESRDDGHYVIQGGTSINAGADIQSALVLCSVLSNTQHPVKVKQEDDGVYIQTNVEHDWHKVIDYEEAKKGTDNRTMVRFIKAGVKLTGKVDPIKSLVDRAFDGKDLNRFIMDEIGQTEPMRNYKAAFESISTDFPGFRHPDKTLKIVSSNTTSEQVPIPRLSTTNLLDWGNHHPTSPWPGYPWTPVTPVSPVYPQIPVTPISPTTPYPIPEPSIQPVTGWICPVCGAGVSPYKSKCDCTNNYRITNITTTT